MPPSSRGWNPWICFCWANSWGRGAPAQRVSVHRASDRAPRTQTVSRCAIVDVKYNLTMLKGSHAFALFFNAKYWPYYFLTSYFKNSNIEYVYHLHKYVYQVTSKSMKLQVSLLVYQVKSCPKLWYERFLPYVAMVPGLCSIHHESVSVF